MNNWPYLLIVFFITFILAWTIGNAIEDWKVDIEDRIEKLEFGL